MARKFRTGHGCSGRLESIRLILDAEVAPSHPDKEDVMEYLRCKACGYIMEADKLGTVCPACGVPAAQLEAWTSPVKPARKRILDLHIHPVVVHFPQAYAASLVLFAVLLAVLPAGRLPGFLQITTLIMAAILPLCGLAAWASGTLDAKIRFRKVKAPLLIRKMVVGGLFILASLAAALVALTLGLSGTGLVVFAVLEVLTLGCGTFLGIWGSGLTNAAFPG